MPDEPLSLDHLRAIYRPAGWTILSDPSNGLLTGFREVGTERHVVCDYTVKGLAEKLARAAGGSDG